MNFNYATLVTLWDANGKNHINGIENFFQRECVLLVASKTQLSTRATTCVATASKRGYAKHRLLNLKVSSQA